MYLWIKVLHVVSVVAFLGNITTGLFWHMHASRSRDPALLAFTMEGIIRSDRIFTMPGVIGIIITGVANAVLGQIPILRTGWIFWTLALFSVSGLVFGLRVAPLQRRLLTLARDGVRFGSFEYSKYEAMARRWEFWGAIALITPVVGLVLMVLKPAL